MKKDKETIINEFIEDMNKGYLGNKERMELCKKIASCNNINFQIRCLRKIEFLPGRSEIVDTLAQKQPEDFLGPKDYEHFLREMIQVNDIRLKPWFDKILSLETVDVSTLTLALRRAYNMIKNSSYTGRVYVGAFFEKILESDIKSKDLGQIIDVVDEYKEKFNVVDEEYFDRFLDLIYGKLKAKEVIDEGLMTAVYWGVNNGLLDEYEVLTMILANGSASPFMRYNVFKKLIKIAEFTDCSKYAEGLLPYVAKGSIEEKFLKEYIVRFRNAQEYYRDGRERLIPQINEMFENLNNEVETEEVVPPIFGNSMFNRGYDIGKTNTKEGATQEGTSEGTTV